jgi:hypothetical protein
MKRHQINIDTLSGKTWASCSTCKLSSKQGTKAKAEAWAHKHQEDVLNNVRIKSMAKKSRPFRSWKEHPPWNK